MPWDQDRLRVDDFMAMVDQIDQRNAEAKQQAREARRRERG